MLIRLLILLFFTRSARSRVEMYTTLRDSVFQYGYLIVYGMFVLLDQTSFNHMNLQNQVLKFILLLFSQN